MAAEDVINEDPDLYDITDFTTSTDWERFIASIEAVIHEWKLTSLKPLSPLHEGELTNGTWETSSEDISFAQFGFRITRHYLIRTAKQDDDDMLIEGSSNDLPPFALEDMLAFGNDFPPRAHYLVRWYGIRDFLVLSPNPEDQIVRTEDRAKLLLSSISLALSNSKCPLPAFVQLHHAQERLCFGVCTGGGITTYFDMVHIVHIPPACGTLSGLLSLFKTKMSCSSQVSLPPVDLTIRFTYIINDWSSYAWPQLPPDVTEELDDAELLTLQEIPFGALEEPILEMQLSVTWPSLPEDVIIDSDVHSDLHPTSAPTWLVRMRWSERPQCIMGEYLQTFLNLCDKKGDSSPALKNIFIEDEASASANFRDVLDRMAPQASLPVSLTASLRHTSENMGETQSNILGSEVLMKIMGYVFLTSDNKEAEDKVSLDENLDTDSLDGTNISAKVNELKENLCTMKTTHPESLVWRLALAVSYVYYNWGDPQAIQQLWVKVVSEIRHSWDNCYMLPSLEPGAPNLATCLLHQKLQMLNCCIERKIKRERRQQMVDSGAQAKSGSSESDEEEFYECPDEFGVETKKDSTDAEADIPSAGDDARVGEGILRQCGNLTLLGTSKPLYIPVIQDPVSMTEDMLEEHAEALVQLGSNAEGAALRARMQSACLLSDMEAFKAANPGASLGDFVRWYSPRDWTAPVIDEVSGEVLQEGHLSSRMQLPGNTWQEVWDTARPIPAHRQKRLFDDTKEAEKVLHHLLSMSPASIANQLMPVLVHCALAKLVQKASKGPPSLIGTLEQTIAKISGELRGKAPKYKEILQLLYDAEVAIVRGESLRQKFDQIQHSELSGSALDNVYSKQQLLSGKRRHTADPERYLDSFALDLLDKPEVDVPGAGKGPVGKMLTKLFVDSQKVVNVYQTGHTMRQVLLFYWLGRPVQVTDTTPDEEPVSEHKFPVPVGREYILRARYARPTPASRPTPQRMYCVIAGNDFRLAGAFTHDTVFY